MLTTTIQFTGVVQKRRTDIMAAARMALELDTLLVWDIPRQPQPQHPLESAILRPAIILPRLELVTQHQVIIPARLAITLAEMLLLPVELEVLLMRLTNIMELQAL